MGVPSLCQALLHQNGRKREVGQEVAVGAAEAVIGLLGGYGQSLFQQIQVEVQEEAAVKEQGVAASPLGIAGELQAVDGEVGVTFFAHGVTQEGAQNPSMALEHVVVALGDALKKGRAVEAENEGVIENPGPLENGAAAGAAAQHRQIMLAAKSLIDFGSNRVGVADNDEVTGRFPETQDFALGGVVAVVEQRLVQGEVFFGRLEGQVKVLHADALLGSISGEHG